MPGYIDEQVKDLIINQLTREEYQELKRQGLVQRNQIYLFPDATEEDIELIKEKLRELIEAHNELAENVEYLDSLVQIINEAIWGQGSSGHDGIIDRLNNIDSRLIVVEEWINSQSSEGSIYTRLTEVEHEVHDVEQTVVNLDQTVQNIDARVTNVENIFQTIETSEFDGVIIYAGTSTDVMGNP